jgi:hypothetical protein
MLTTIFDPGECICTGETVFDTSIYALEDAPPGQYFSINPLNGRRRDSNVAAFRNILIEFDGAPLELQRRMVADLAMPYTSCVFSGKKSYHFIISLENALPDRSSYDRLVRRIHHVVKLADKSTKNPSRFSRYPNYVRPDTGAAQSLIDLRARVNNVDLNYWLSSNNALEAEPERPPERERPKSGLRPIVWLLPKTKEFIAKGAQPGSRNSSLFAAACDMTRAGFTRDEITRIAHRHGLTDLEFTRAIDSAIAAARLPSSEY